MIKEFLICIDYGQKLEQPLKKKILQRRRFYKDEERTSDCIRILSS